MNHQEVVDEISGRAYTAWQSTGFEMIFPDVALTPFQTALIDGKDESDLEPWARVTIRTAGRGQASFGSSAASGRTFDETGIVMIEIYTPTGSGLKQAYTLADIILHAFEGVQTNNSVFYYDCKYEESGSEGMWSRITFTAIWENREAR